MIAFLLALLGGALLTVQVGINNSLRGVVGTPIWAAFISFFVGAVFLGAIGVVSRLPLPNLNAPLWMWTGGILGATYVFLSVSLAQKLSAATFVGCVIAGQLLTSIVVDHFGWLGFSQHVLSPTRVAGAFLLGIAVWMIKNG